jgi:hypothetical protein
MSFSSNSNNFSFSANCRGRLRRSQRPWRLWQVNARDTWAHSSRCIAIIRMISRGRLRAHRFDGARICRKGLAKRSMASWATVATTIAVFTRRTWGTAFGVSSTNSNGNAISMRRCSEASTQRRTLAVWLPHCEGQVQVVGGVGCLLRWLAFLIN